jgi:hypothetical protein
MSITAVTKNVGATVTNATNGGTNSSATDFQAQMAEFQRVAQEQMGRSMKLREVSMIIGTNKDVAKDRGQ